MQQVIDAKSSSFLLLTQQTRPSHLNYQPYLQTRPMNPTYPLLNPFLSRLPVPNKECIMDSINNNTSSSLHPPNPNPNPNPTTGCTAPTPTWPERIETLTHVLTHQTLSPSLHSHFFVSLRVPCFLDWSFPPFLCPSPTSLPSWSFSFFLSRVSRLGLPHTTWRSLCPFQQPPPCILSSGVEPPPDRWGPQERREYARKRMRRGRFGVQVPQVLLFAVPNIVLLSLVLLFDPLWRRPS